MPSVQEVIDRVRAHEAQRRLVVLSLIGTPRDVYPRRRSSWS
jgi:hypothetical protein